MARTTGPLFSVAASGKFRDILEFRTGGGRTIAARTKQVNPPRSPAQEAQATRFATAISGWSALGASAKNDWKAAATPLGLTGYQFYLSEYCAQHITPPDQPTIPG